MYIGEVAVCSVSLSLGKSLKNYSHVNWLLRKPIMQGTMAFSKLGRSDSPKELYVRAVIDALGANK